MADKRRVQLWLSKDLVARGQAAAERLPGMSFSLYTDQVLRDAVPMLEALADMYESADPTAQRQLFADAFADNIVRILEEMESDG